jgi:maleylpyruvate isomerase
MQLFTYFRSSASYRVRIALNLKGLEAEHIAVNLAKGEQLEADYARWNPQQLIPALVADEGSVLTQSLAIIEYLEECYPDTPRLLPADAEGRAKVRALAQAISSDIAPLNNLRVLKYLISDMGVSEEQKTAWYHHWVAAGFAALESMLQYGQAGKFCYGDQPTIADCCLVPQVYNAQRFSCDLSAYPTVMQIARTCAAHPAFAAAHPSKQPDAQN